MVIPCYFIVYFCDYRGNVENIGNEKLAFYDKIEILCPKRTRKTGWNQS